MKTKQILKVLPVMFTLTAAFGQTAAERLEQGVQLQSAEGDFTGAIAEYQEVLKAAAKSQRLAAEAHFRLAECYSALGKVEKMEGQLKLLREGFPGDNQWVVKSWTFMPKTWEFSGTPWRDGYVHTYEVKLKNGSNLGYFLVANRKKAIEPEEVWESIAVRTAGGRSLSRSVFASKGYRPIEARWYFDLFGDATMTFEGGEKVTLSDSETGEKKGDYDYAKEGDLEIPMFENEQAIQLLRALKQEVGTKQKTRVYAAHNNGMMISFDLEVTDHVDLKVPAGTFSCAKIETSLKQTFYVSRGEHRELVRMDMGAANIDLIKSEVWDIAKPRKFSSGEFGTTVMLPGAVLSCPPVANEEVYRLEVWAGDFAGTEGLLEINKKSNLLPEGQKGSRELAELLHKGYAKNYDEFTVFEDWDEIEINGVKAFGMRVKMKKGELNLNAYQVHTVGDKHALSFRLNYAKPDEEKAIARAKEIVASFRW